MDAETRFEEIVRQDGDNDMAWFSLGGAYAQAERHAEAAEAYRKCVELNGDMSKAYQLAGQAYIACDQAEQATEILQRGYTVAATRGDLLPKDAMAEMLGSLGAEVPDVQQRPRDEADAGEGGSFQCRKTGRPGTRLPRPPFRNALGAWIQDNISKQTFDEWLGLGTKIINELRLDFSRDDHDAVYDYAMRRFIGVDDQHYQELMGRPPVEPGGEFKQVIDQILDRGGHLEEFQGELHKGVSG